MTTTVSLEDGAARTSVLTDLDSTLFVEAGAGSGKTTALVGRIVALVASGRAEMRNIAAVTFTEAAAVELRLRVREQLALMAEQGAPDQRSRVSEALGHIDEAPISTIHGLCQRILASHPIEAGLPPRFEIFDEIGESIEWKRRWSEDLDLLASEQRLSGLVSISWALGVKARRLEILAKAVDEQWHLQPETGLDAESALAAADVRATKGIAELRRAIDAAVEARPACASDDDRLAEYLHSLAGYSRELAASKHWKDVLALVASFEVTARRRGTEDAWPSGIEAVRDRVAEAANVWSELVHDLVDISVLALARYFEVRAVEAAAERRRTGRLTFHDLLVFTRDLLRDHPVVRTEVRRNVRYLLIDEVQDTDPLQIEIARLIGRPSGGESWEAGRCFFVGDPKQSIYRFRGADLRSYEAARTEVAGGDPIFLTSNFRSAPGIIDFVNTCFQQLLGESFHALDAARDVATLATSAQPVCLVGGELESGMRVGQQRQIESVDCCRVIELAVATERWQVFDAEFGTTRPARLGDIAILVPRRTGLPELEAELDRRQIPYRIESASLIFKSQEVRDVLALARALEAPGQSSALVAVLRSPAYSIGDDELARFAAAGGRWTVEQEPPAEAASAAPRAAEALSDLRRLRSHLKELGPAATLSFAVRERRLFQMAADRPRARESWRMIRYLVDRARAFVDAGGGGLTEFADWVDEQVAAGMRAAESIVPDADEDVVRIMTVHGAKGLEFPIAILCGFGTTDPLVTLPDTIHRQPGGATQVHFTNALETSGYRALHKAEQALELEEAFRVLYVAATRARDYLVVCGHYVPGDKASLGQQLLAAAAKLPNRPRQIPSVVAPGGAAQGPQGPPFPPATAQDGPAVAAAAGAGGALGIGSLADYVSWCEHRESVVAAACRRSSIPATEVFSLIGGTDAPSVVAAADPEEDFGRTRGRAASQIGRAVHATLQSIALADTTALSGDNDTGGAAAARLRTISEVQAAAEHVADRAAEVGRLAAAALSSPTVRHAFASGTARREAYVCASVDGTVVDGFVDLCFTDEDGSIVVVDYKTDYVRDGAEATERARQYEYQAAAYALALGDVTGRPAAKCVFVFLALPGEPFEYELSGGDLVARVSTVRRAVEAYGASPP